MNIHFPRIITLLRKERKISQKKAASDLNISQALLSHYEKGIRECGLYFLVQIANYYEVSCDYLLGRTPDKSGKVLRMEDIPDSDEVGKENVFKGSLLAALNKKLILNSTTIIFDILHRIACKPLTTEVSSYLTIAIYKMFRLLYSVNSKNPQGLFCVQKYMQKGLSDASAAIAEARATAIASKENQSDLEGLTDDQRLIFSPEILSKEYPLFASSLYNLIQNAELRMGVKKS
jgi:transcriptional regulator with XRE-family HTH domain